MVEATNLKSNTNQTEDVGLCLIKLVTGEELLGYVTNNMNEPGPRIRNPIQVIVVPPKNNSDVANIGMLDWLPTMKGDTVLIYATAIVAMTEPQETLVKYWNDKFDKGPKLIMPIKPKLVT